MVVFHNLHMMNHHPIHIDKIFAQKSNFKKILVVGTYVFSLVVGMSVRDISGKAIANLNYEGRVSRASSHLYLEHNSQLSAPLSSMPEYEWLVLLLGKSDSRLIVVPPYIAESCRCAHDLVSSQCRGQGVVCRKTTGQKTYRSDLNRALQTIAPLGHTGMIR